jgi:hypothetical protein
MAILSPTYAKCTDLIQICAYRLANCGQTTLNLFFLVRSNVADGDAPFSFDFVWIDDRRVGYYVNSRPMCHICFNTFFERLWENPGPVPACVGDIDLYLHSRLVGVPCRSEDIVVNRPFCKFTKLGKTCNCICNVGDDFGVGVRA